MPAVFVKAYADIFCPVLTYIFNLSIITCAYPDAWKSSLIIAVHKSGDNQEWRDHRPISILSKVFEQIVYKYLYSHFKSTIIET